MLADTAMPSLENPVFLTCVLAASIMILKLMLQPWMTVVPMMKAGGGFRSPEGARKNPLNPRPEPTQLEVNEYVDRSRRINLNNLESIPGFLAAGFLRVLSHPPLLPGQVLIWTYVASRAAHFVAYSTAQLHDVRAFCRTWGSISAIAMAMYSLVKALFEPGAVAILLVTEPQGVLPFEFALGFGSILDGQQRTESGQPAVAHCCALQSSIGACRP